MSQPNTITLSDPIFEQVQYLAALRQEEVSQVVERLLRQALPNSFFRANGAKQAINGTDGLAEPVGHPNTEPLAIQAEPDLASNPEITAYYALHPMLWKMYPEQYVAIHNGQLVDHDVDGFALSLRIYQRYPDDFVLIRKVEEEAETLLQVRSPRFV